MVSKVSLWLSDESWVLRGENGGSNAEGQEYMFCEEYAKVYLSYQLFQIFFTQYNNELIAGAKTYV